MKKKSFMVSHGFFTHKFGEKCNLCDDMVKQYKAWRKLSPKKFLELLTGK